MPPPSPAAIDALDQALRQSHNLRTWLRGRRWCGDSLGVGAQLAVKDRAVLAESGTEALVLFLAVMTEENQSVPVHLPLSLSSIRTDPDAFDLPMGGDRFYVTEAERRESYARFLLDAFHERSTIPTATGDTVLFRGDDLGSFRSTRPASEDSSNLLVTIDTTRRAVLFKSYKLLDVGNREADLLQRLAKKEFPHAPRYLGEMALGKGDDRLVLGVATEHVESTDAFLSMTEGWRTELASEVPSDFESASIALAGRLGEAIAGLHTALSDRHPGP